MLKHVFNARSKLYKCQFINECLAVHRKTLEKTVFFSQVLITIESGTNGLSIAKVNE